MTNVAALIEQKKQIEAQLAEIRQESVAAVRKLMADTGVTLSDLGPVQRGKAAPTYRDPAGNTWSGRGRHPLWVTAAMKAGTDLEQFRVR